MDMPHLVKYWIIGDHCTRSVWWFSCCHDAWYNSDKHEPDLKEARAVEVIHRCRGDPNEHHSMKALALGCVLAYNSLFDVAHDPRQHRHPRAILDYANPPSMHKPPHTSERKFLEGARKETPWSGEHVHL